MRRALSPDASGGQASSAKDSRMSQNGAVSGRKRLPPSPAVDERVSISMLESMRAKTRKFFYGAIYGSMVTVLNAESEMFSSAASARAQSALLAQSVAAEDKEQQQRHEQTLFLQSHGHAQGLIQMQIPPPAVGRDGDTGNCSPTSSQSTLQVVAPPEPKTPVAAASSSVRRGSVPVHVGSSLTLPPRTPTLGVEGFPVSPQMSVEDVVRLSSPNLFEPNFGAARHRQERIPLMRMSSSEEIALWQSRSVETARSVMNEVRKLFMYLVSADGSKVAYHLFLQSAQASEFTQSMRRLRELDPSILSEKQRLAFFLNCYNALMIHAIATQGKPSNGLERARLYASSAYDIGGRVYTLNDMEHGILRSYRAPPNQLAWMTILDDQDARLLCKLNHLDARIHMALNCGAASCPRIEFYDENEIDSQLDLAVRNFLSDGNRGLAIDQTSQVILLSQIFSWYRDDFCDAMDHMATDSWASDGAGVGGTHADESTTKTGAERTTSAETARAETEQQKTTTYSLNSKDANLLKWIEQYVEGERKEILHSVLHGEVTYRIEYFAYDWASNATPL
ncbi:hypothetical protein FVE85_6606 [Porphyridium purpureum]|uniref:DUF547 domain-containing protein n=1 Tax=Porphyridium purpureum TaxID=35688 RepID=A0A5J4Z562_PORPP|nr:hypothetical protein FVE85_6606 [Porphyridium purpureum]|eukprot:POR7376..scf295_1